MRSLRRRRRLGNVAWGDLAYRVYTTGLGTIVLVVFASGLVGDSRLTPTATEALIDAGPQWVGLMVAAMILIGTRSGARGGPVALEAADVHNLLLAPVSRWKVLTRPAIGTVGYGTAAVVATGALGGLLIAQRAPGGNAAFIGSCMLAGFTAASLAFGAAMLTASRLVDRRIPLLVGWCLVVAAVARIAGLITWAPTDLVGSIAFWPLEFTPGSIITIPLGVVLAAVGLRTLGNLSIELAQQRTQLVGQLRFAVTQQDLRSVLLLRRQLAAEHPIGSNRLRFMTGPTGRRFPVVARSLASVGRWPLMRIIRVIVLGIAAGVAAKATWDGTTPLVLVSGLCTYVGALDVLEPLAQEVDHPLLVDSYPEDRGILFLHHLGPAFAVMFVVLVPGTVVATILAGRTDAGALAALVTLTAALAAISGGAVSMVGEATLSAVDEVMMPPEVAGPRVVMKTLWPPFVAVTGFGPVVGALLAHRGGVPVLRGALLGSIVPLLLTGAVLLWVFYRDEIHRTMNEAMGR